jgi:hypothetical protein
VVDDLRPKQTIGVLLSLGKYAPQGG